MRIKAISTVVLLVAVLTSCLAPNSNSPISDSIPSPNINHNLSESSTTQPPRQSPAIENVKDDQTSIESITLYELSASYWEAPLHEIPFYKNGELAFLDSKNDLDKLNQDITWESLIQDILLEMSNLLPQNLFPEITLPEEIKQSKLNTNEIFNFSASSGIKFTLEHIEFPDPPYISVNVPGWGSYLLTNTPRSSSITLDIPEWGSYTVTWKIAHMTNIPFIQKITFSKAKTFNPTLVENPLIIYSLPQKFFKKKLTEIPYYSAGNINYLSAETIKSVGEGHSVWINHETLTASNGTANLIPSKIDIETVIYKDSISINDKESLVEMIVPDWGTYKVTVISPDKGIQFISRIEFAPQ